MRSLNGYVVVMVGLMAVSGPSFGQVVQVADGGSATIGAKSDGAVTDSTAAGTAMSFWKGVVKILDDVWDSTHHRVYVDGSGVTQPVSGTFWQTIQPVSGTFWQTTQPVSGTFWQTTQPVSVASLPLPAGGATSANQATIIGLMGGGLPSALAGSGGLKVDLSGTGANAAALKVDGSAVTQPVSGTFWQATQPVSGTFWQATQPVSGTFWQATQPVSGTFWQVTQPVSIASGATPAGTNAIQVQGTAASGAAHVGSPLFTSSSADHAAVVTPSDSTNLANAARGLFIGSTGNLVVDTAGGETSVTLTNVPVGVLPLQVVRVRATGTTATSIVELW